MITKPALPERLKGRSNNTHLNNELVNHEIMKELKSTWKQMKIKTTVQNLWDAAKVVLRGKSIAIQSTSRRKISNKQPNLILKGVRKRTTKENPEKGSK